MARRKRSPGATSRRALRVQNPLCAECGRKLWWGYRNHRKVRTLQGVEALDLQVQFCGHKRCGRYRWPCRPEEEGGIALPQYEFGLDVIALVGALRYQQHRSVPEIHQELAARELIICQRTVTNLLDRYDELLALRLSASRRLQQVTARHQRVILSLDGLQPDVGHEVLWVLRDTLSGEVLLARSLLSSTEADLAALLREVQQALSVPIVGVISDGQHSIRNAVTSVLPGVPHQLCHFHYLREAARPIYEADRHAKKELKKRVRGIRAIEREVESHHDTPAEAVQGYCAAVRSALTDDGRPPLVASGLKLQGRLQEISASLEKVKKKRGSPNP